jgi:hypothetical protein
MDVFASTGMSRTLHDVPLIDAATLHELFGNLEQIRGAHQTVVNEMDAILPRLKRILSSQSVYLRIVASPNEIIL